ncbi:phage gp6-like head-tail connector protein [Escherichia coli]|uniref:phage gp6-like head-tail connector protein n=1 Tax=Escherichia coli TaxID=562 RepID=UPI000D0A49E3|nr:phage gp6-like head-tail connector protein [Escherichia coli]
MCCGENITFHQVAKFSVPLHTAVLLAYIQGSRDKVISEDGELIPGEALTRMKGAAMRLTGMLYRNPDLAEREDLVQGELPFSVSVLIYDLRCPTVL